MYKKTFYSDNFTVDPAFCSIDPNMLAMHHHHHHSQQQQDDVVSPYVVPASVMPPTPTPFLDPSATPFSPDEGLDDFPVMYPHDEDNTTGMVDVAVAPYLTNYYQQQQQQYHSPQPATVNNTPDMGAANINYQQQQQQQQEHHLFPALAKAKVFTCPTCHRQFNRRYNLGTHMKTHDKQRYRPFGCPECPKRFDRKHDRKRHIQTVHRGERLYPCDQCNAEFSRKDALMRHKDQKHLLLQYIPQDVGPHHVHPMYD